MTENEKNLMMAYAIGAATPKEVGNVRYDLKDICDAYKSYTIVGFRSSRMGCNWMLYYNGDYGPRIGYSCMMNVNEGLSMKHIVCLFVQAIQMHQAELKRKKE